MIPVILSGGSGTRMWPYSRSMYPKQFLPIVGDDTMLQATLLRLSEADNIGKPIVVCNEDHRFMVAEQLRSIDIQCHSILLEPVGRNTAPAIALSALKLLDDAENDEEPVMLVLPADHVIDDLQAFHAALVVANDAASNGRLVTFGIVAEYAETGYGYIHAKGKGEARVVESFLEKPDSETADAYIDSGDYYWNSGMFVFKASRYIDELAKRSPEILAACRNALNAGINDLDFVRVDKLEFEKCPSNSIDYAIMEPLCSSGTGEVVMVPLDAQWNDVGSWSSLWDVSAKDSDGNSIRGDVLTHDTKNCFLQGEGKLIATVGIEDMVIVQTDDAVLVAAKDKVQNVKKIVEQLKQHGRPEKDLHRKVYRPWGYYDSIDSGDRFQVKRLVVKPGAKLSLQMHHHRAEHWVVVSGTAEVTNGDKLMLLKENESTYIPIGTTHSLANPGKIALEIIEVQSGSYLGEDDIVRFEDVYGRA